jgi:ubiquinone/menaquinone biosynthesis C-methylase UbiE
MNPEEYKNLATVEQNHWYYSGKRKIVSHWMRESGHLTRDSLLLDCGAGTGAFAAEMQSRCRVFASDDYAESLAILRDRLGEERVIAASCTNLPLPDNKFDFVTALDVLEHIEEDSRALSEIYRVTKPGGMVIITVPALMSLWSDWDVTLRHFRRYDRKSLNILVDQYSFQTINLNYMNFWAFPVVWALRRLRGRGNAESKKRAEDKIPRNPFNSLLRSIFIWSSCQRFIKWPFGVGLLAVLVKK